MEKAYSPPGKPPFCSYKQQSCLPGPRVCHPRCAFVWAHPGWIRTCSHRETCGHRPSAKQVLCAPQCACAFILDSLANSGPFQQSIWHEKRFSRSSDQGSPLQFFKTSLNCACNFYSPGKHCWALLLHAQKQKVSQPSGASSLVPHAGHTTESHHPVMSGTHGHIELGQDVPSVRDK